MEFIKHDAKRTLSIYAQKLAGGHGVAPSYVNLESTRSPIDPPPAIRKAEKLEKSNTKLQITNKLQ